MELLIPGLILVALMAYASTRIKRSAARAFESETIESDEFIIQKPEGFLNVLNGDPQFAFEAYSKPYGVDPAQEFRQCTVNLRIIEGSGLAKVAADIKKSGAAVVNEINEVINEIHYRIIEVTRVKKGIEFRVVFKLAERNGKVFQLEAAALSSADEEFARKLETFIDSYEVK